MDTWFTVLWLTPKETLTIIWIPSLISLVVGVLLLLLDKIIFKWEIKQWIVKQFKYILKLVSKYSPYRIYNKNKYITIDEHKQQITNFNNQIVKLKNLPNIPDVIINVFIDSLVHNTNIRISIPVKWSWYYEFKEPNNGQSIENCYYAIYKQIDSCNKVIRHKISKEWISYIEVHLWIDWIFWLPKSFTEHK
jgi:hypothetical protein